MSGRHTTGGAGHGTCGVGNRGTSGAGENVPKERGPLYVVVQTSGSKSYEFRYRRNGKVHAVVIGNVNDGDLADARKVVGEHLSWRRLRSS